MGIDGIGKGGAPPLPTGIDGTGAPAASEIGSGGEFKVSRAAAIEAPSVASLDQVRAGAISVSQYLDIKVNEATSHLVDRVNGEQLSFIRESLRAQLSSDPALIDLVKSTTGQLPPRDE